MKSNKLYLFILAMTTLWVVMAFSGPGGKGKLTINISHYVNETMMELDTVTYTNKLGQPFTVTKFKYYISNVVLHSAGGPDVVLPGYYLVNEEEPASKQLLWEDVPAGQYTSLSFMIGVDSAHNTTGVQSGALDPVNGMFWTWNTGYVFLKFEGKAAASKSPGNLFEYHIGGYRTPANSLRVVKLDLPKVIDIKEGGRRVVQVKADAAEVLKAPTTIDFSVLPSVTDATNAAVIADNYKDMFSVIGID